MLGEASASLSLGGERMIFKSTPNLFCKISNKYVQRATGMKGFHFDGKGEYVTENEVLIKVLSQSFEVAEEVTAEMPKVDEEAKPRVVMHCKKCDFEADNHGGIMAHYKTKHPKGVKK
jgi:hypothetical protein